MRESKSIGQQIIVGIIVTVVGGVVLAWIIGDGRFASTNQAEEPLQVIATSVPAIKSNGVNDSESIASDIFEAAQSASEEPVNLEPIGIKNPSGTIETGTSILTGDYSLVVVGDFEVQNSTAYPESNRISIGRILIENVASEKRSFRYRRTGLRLIDDLGNEYQPYAHGEEELLYSVQSLDLDAAEFGTIGYACTSCRGGIMFSGTIPPEASKLFIVFDDFGVFSGFQIEIRI